MDKVYLLKLYGGGQVRELHVRPINKGTKTKGQQIAITGSGVQPQMFEIVKVLK